MSSNITERHAAEIAERRRALQAKDAIRRLQMTRHQRRIASDVDRIIARVNATVFARRREREGDDGGNDRPILSPEVYQTTVRPGGLPED